MSERHILRWLSVFNSIYADQRKHCSTGARCGYDSYSQLESRNVGNHLSKPANVMCVHSCLSASSEAIELYSVELSSSNLSAEHFPAKSL